MKYVVLIHSNPDPWGHPTVAYTPEGRAMPASWREESGREFDEMLAQISESGELVTAEALADPASATLYRWSAGGVLTTDGPYAETKEHLAGFFLLDCATRERAEALAARFAGPGDVIELRPAMSGGGDDA